MSKAYQVEIGYFSGNVETTTVYARTAEQATKMIQRDLKRTGLKAEVKVRRLRAKAM
jgi:hypothetical protein